MEGFIDPRFADFGSNDGGFPTNSPQHNNFFNSPHFSTPTDLPNPPSSTATGGGGGSRGNFDSGKNNLNFFDSNAATVGGIFAARKDSNTQVPRNVMVQQHQQQHQSDNNVWNSAAAGGGGYEGGFTQPVYEQGLGGPASSSLSSNVSTHSSYPVYVPGGSFASSTSGSNAAAFQAMDPTYICSGLIKSRTSLRTLVTKSWKDDTFYVLRSPAVLSLFRSQEDYEGYLNNSYLSRKEREYLIKLNVDFSNDLKQPGVRGFNVTEIKGKHYSKVYIYQCKVEKIMDYGPNIVGVFGSEREEDVVRFRDVVGRIIMQARNDGSGVNNHGVGTVASNATGGGGNYDTNSNNGNRVNYGRYNETEKGRKGGYDFGSLER